MRATTRSNSTSDHGLELSAAALEEMRGKLSAVADDVVAAIVDEVPSYRDAFSGPMGETIRNAVQLALGGFLTLASRGRTEDLRTPTAPAVEGSYQLGRGEARSGRTTDALLAAFRIGARVSWRELSAIAVRNGLPADVLADFAELVFAYIDELSAAAVAGHTDETETTGRVRQRLLERVAVLLLDGAPADEVTAAAESAGWTPPTTLTAVLVPESQVRPVLGLVAPGTIQASETPGLDEAALLLVPDAHARRRTALLRTLARPRLDRRARPSPGSTYAASVDRALRARELGIELDTEAELPRLVLHADESALADLRARVLAPLEGLRPGTAEKLADTLRAWLLHQGRREDIAAALFVHPQTVRYRMGQLRDLYGDKLDDPDTVLALDPRPGLSAVACAMVRARAEVVRYHRCHGYRGAATVRAPASPACWRRPRGSGRRARAGRRRPGRGARSRAGAAGATEAGHEAVSGPSTAAATAAALPAPVATRSRCRARRMVPSPWVSTWCGTSSSEPKNRALSRRVCSVSVLIRVVEESDEPGSLKAR